jgi:hypothetical protein
MKSTLICSKGCRHRLTWTTDHSASSYGLGVMLDSRGEVFCGAALLADPGARIETTDPEKVCLALALPDSAQVVKKAK